jgi:hypothetical protein
VLGSLGSTCLLLGLSFRYIWSELAREQNVIDEIFLVGVAVSLAAMALLIYSIKQRGVQGVHPLAFLFLVFIAVFEMGRVYPSLAPWIVNILVLGIAVVTTWRGAEKDSMFILNYGLLIMVILILCRFFDTDMSFVVRGILFLVTGFSFFGANYWVLRKRKLHDV